MMTIYHQSNVTRLEEVGNKARRAANTVPGAHLPKYCRAEVGVAPALRGKCPRRVVRWEEVQSPKVGRGREQL